MRTYKLLLLASITASVISTISSWFFYSKWNEVEDGHYELLKKNSELSAAYDLLETAFDSLSEESAVFRDPDFKVIPVNDRSSFEKSACRIWWNPYNRHTYIDPLALPRLSNDSIYQLWCMAAGKPQLITAMSGDPGGGKLHAAGDVAVAETWMVRASLPDDTVFSGTQSVHYRSGY